MLRNLATWLALAVGVSGFCFCEPLPKVSDAAALRHLVRSVAPIYPEQARMGRISGLVRVQLTVDETGSVNAVRVIRGHPLLAPAAVNALKGWKFQPFEVNGKPLTVLADVDVPFSLSSQEQQFYAAYLPALHQAEEELATFSYADAARHAAQARQVAEAAGPHRWALLADAVSLLARIRMSQREYSDAETLYREALKLQQSNRKASEPEIGQALSDLGACLMAETKNEEANATLATAVEILGRRAGDTRKDDAKQTYRRALAVDTFNLARLAKDRGDQNQAKSWCREAMNYVEASQTEELRRSATAFCLPLLVTGNP